ncbi:MAG TPA: hypothetical protein VLQ45_19065 [Thermoanaerobaculia bacterium]|nr:hypothetical protein [Thermoanaerobaculia bacterium]
MAAQLRNILCEAQAGEAIGEPGAERCLGDVLISDRVAEDLTNLFFRAAAVTACAALKLGLHIVVKVSDQELSHGEMMA